jgi:hypothetical protein
MKCIPILFLFCVLSFTANAQVICYSYDAAGNRTTKVIGPCSPFQLVTPPENGIQSLELDSEKSTDLYQTVRGGLELTVNGKVVPNPTEAIFQLILDTEPPLGSILELYDSAGRKIQTQQTQGFSAFFDISKESTGMYYLFLKAESGIVGEWKIVKQ